MHLLIVDLQEQELCWQISLGVLMLGLSTTYVSLGIHVSFLSLSFFIFDVGLFVCLFVFEIESCFVSQAGSTFGFPLHLGT